jgi:hypothetical protein
MNIAKRNCNGDWVDQEGNDTFSSAYKTLLETEYQAKAMVLDSEGDSTSATALEGYKCIHCDFYNLDISNQDEIIYTSGIVNFCLNKVRQKAIRFRHG